MVNHELMVSVYHHIKQNPEHWYQGEWACHSGMCIAGWTLTLNGVEWDATAVVGLHDLWPRGHEPLSAGINASAADFLGLNHARACELFHAHNTLTDIREIMTGILGYDPETALPSEDILLEAKHLARKYYGS